MKINNILALDQARHCGWSIAINGTLTEYGEKDLGSTEQEKHLGEFIYEMIQKHDITEIIAEDIYLGENRKTFKKLGHYQGVIMEASRANGISCTFVEPTRWKQAIARNAYASKEEIQNIINRGLKYPIKSNNITDSIGILFYHLRRKKRVR